jgi:serine/threonine protein kinase
MTPERSDLVSKILETAISLDITRRQRYLDAACSEDSDLRREVDSLLDAHEKAGDQFLNIPPGVRPDSAQEGLRRGKRIGPYLVEEQIGHGGMGEVYAATRADGQFTKRVAIKLVRSGFDNALLLERFRNERQILATLVHPNIAQLLDGGTSEDGIPYLVMELVDGVPIDTYCERQKLGISERLKLFRQVCSAVQYAHQHLVVHRDIKPSNIFVTKDGTPKLLDFGIAKIVGESGATDVTALRPMTPEFASPEQIKGGAITTASDVYSLGVVLYRLLTGRSPYRVNTNSAQELSHAIADLDPEPPSAAVLRKSKDPFLSPMQFPEGSLPRFNRRLASDLDFILLKALRKEPQQRYGTVEQFAEDVRRHMEGLPVYARKGTWAYHASKFIHRHRAAVVGTSLVAISLIIGLIATVHEARIAEENRRRAERRFNDVRQLANSLMFEVHDSIRNLPGATAARLLIIERAQQYLDSLAEESQSDPSLLLELATAYSRLAMVQGDVLNANLGQSAQSAKNYRKAVDLLVTCTQLQPDSLDTQRALADGYLNLSLALARTGDRSLSKKYSEKAVQLLEDMAKKRPEDKQIQSSLGQAYERIGALAADGNNLPVALAYYEKALDVLQRIEGPDAKLLPLVSSAHKHIGSVLAVQNQLDKALAHYQSALAIDQEVLDNDPDNVQARYTITFSYSDMGWILNRKGDSAAALQYYSRAMEIRQALVAVDPEDVRAQRGLASTYNFVGVIHRDRHEYEAAVQNLQKALDIRLFLVKKDPSNDRYPIDVADSTGQLGITYFDFAFQPGSSEGETQGRCRQALVYLRKSLPVFQAAKAQGKLTGTEVNRPELLAKEIARCTRIVSGTE